MRYAIRILDSDDMPRGEIKESLMKRLKSIDYSTIKETDCNPITIWVDTHATLRQIESFEEVEFCVKAQ